MSDFPIVLTNAVDGPPGIGTPITAKIINNIEAKIGIDGSAVTTSLDYLLKNAGSVDPGHKHSKLWASDGSPEVVTVDATGNVGIGTTSPGQRLQVGGSSDANIYQRFTTDSSSWDLGMGQVGGDDNFIIQRMSTGRTEFRIDTYGNVFMGGNAAAGAGTLYVGAGGNVGIRTTNPVISGTGKLHLAGDTFRLDTNRTPASAGAAGNKGDICWDNDFLYVCIDTNTWKKVAIATW